VCFRRRHASIERKPVNLFRVLIALLLIAASASTLAQPRGCAPDEALLQRYVEAHARFTRIATQFRPTTVEAARKRMEDIFDRFYRTATLDRLEQGLARKKKDLEFQSNSPQAPMNRVEDTIIISLIECQILAKRKSLVAANDAANSQGAAATVSDQQGQGGACKAADFEPKVNELRSRFPMNSAWGMNDTYRYSYFFGVEGIKILQRYRTCMSTLDFTANYDALRGMRDKGREGCLKTSSTGDCQASYPGSATH